MDDNKKPGQRDISDLDLVVAGTRDAIVMVEAGAREVDESVVLDAFEAAHAEIRRICALQEELRSAAGKPKLEVTYKPKFTDELLHELMSKHGEAVKAAMQTNGKHERYAAIKAVRNEIVAGVPVEDVERVAAVSAAYGCTLRLNFDQNGACCARTGARHEVADPGLTDDELDSVQQDVFQALGWE